MGTVTGSEGAFSRRRQGGYSLPRGEPGEIWTLVFRVQAMRGGGGSRHWRQQGSTGSSDGDGM